MAKISRKHPVLVTVLKAFIPYSKESFMLGFKPNQFFNKLEYLDRLADYSGSTKQSVRTTISRAKRQGLLRSEQDGRFRTTWLGNIKAGVLPLQKRKRYLVITFDIPETMRRQRYLLRGYLRAMHCEPVQKSVWKTQYDIYEELQEALDDLRIRAYVHVFLAEDVKLTK